MARVELVDVMADDGVRLTALVHPAAGEPWAGVVHLHGKGGRATTGPGRFIPERAAADGVVHLALDMRSSGLGYTRYDVPSPDFTSGDVPVAGGWWERIADGRRDVAAAVDHLRGVGCPRIFLSGHSSGGLYAAEHSARDPHVAGRIFLSPLLSNRTALRVWFPEPGGLDDALDRARALVAAGRGHHVIPLGSWYYGISAASLVERAAEPEDAWDRALAASAAPVLMVWGGAESRDAAWRRAFAAIATEDKRMVVVPGAEHHFVGAEQQVTDAVLAFLDDHRHITAPTAGHGRSD